MSCCSLTKLCKKYCNRSRAARCTRMNSLLRPPPAVAASGTWREALPGWFASVWVTALILQIVYSAVHFSKHAYWVWSTSASHLLLPSSCNAANGVAAAVVVRASPVHGNGLFAMRDWEPGECLFIIAASQAPPTSTTAVQRSGVRIIAAADGNAPDTPLTGEEAPVAKTGVGAGVAAAAAAAAEGVDPADDDGGLRLPWVLPALPHMTDLGSAVNHNWRANLAMVQLPLQVCCRSRTASSGQSEDDSSTSYDDDNNCDSANGGCCGDDDSADADSSSDSGGGGSESCCGGGGGGGDSDDDDDDDGICLWAVTLRPVRAGEELFLNYAAAPWYIRAPMPWWWWW